VLTPANKLLFFPTGICNRQLVSLSLMVQTQQDHLPFQNVLLNMLTNAVCVNDECWWPGCSCTSYRKET